MAQLYSVAVLWEHSVYLVVEDDVEVVVDIEVEVVDVVGTVGVEEDVEVDVVVGVGSNVVVVGGGVASKTTKVYFKEVKLMF